MKKISKKILISVIAMLVLFATAFAALSFSMADEQNGTGETKVYAASGPQTIIDYIIENSKVSASSTATDADPVYHILELGSSDTPSKLMDLVDSDNFRQLVINGNKSDTYPEEMDATAQIEYIYYNATEGNYKKFTKVNGTVTSAVATNEEIVKAIQKADLCYVSNDPSKIFANGNDISEEIKIALSSYATGDQKPLIIDSHNKTQEIINLTSKKMKEVATYDFAPYGGGYCTYKWDSTKDVGTFMDLSNFTDLYIPIDGDEQMSKWGKITSAGATEYVAKVLTINAGSDNTLTNLFSAGFTSAGDVTTDDGVTYTDVYQMPTSSGVYINGYVGRSSRPTYFDFDSINISTNIDDLADVSKVKFSDYDFVIIEKDTAELNFLGHMDAYDSLMSAMYTRIHILYDSSMVFDTSSSTITPCTAANFKYVYDKVASPTDNPKFAYIMVGTRNKMSGYAASVSAEGVKDIADVINAGSFRGIKTNSGDDSSNVYTALEIEPCYPINSELAGIFTDKGVENYTDNYSIYKGNDALTFKDATGRDRVTTTTEGSKWWGSKGFYYLRTSGILDATSDEISYDDNKSLTQMLDEADYSSITSDNSNRIVDYYDWALSKAKVAHALGVSANEVRVVHMSSAEFAASKDTLLDSYDMIYIGGNTSSVQDTQYLMSGDNYYKMYRHNGETYPYPSADFIGGKDGTVGVLVGNDITDDKLKELKEYVSKGMPVVFDKDVSASFEAGKDIDPYSNMYEFMSYASGNSFKSSTIWNFDQTYTIKLANVGNKYGTTYSGYATVFAQDKTTGYSEDEKPLIMGVRRDTRTDATVSIDDYLAANLEDDIQCETQLKILIQGKQRPRLAVTQMPKRYVEGDQSSWISSTRAAGTTLTWNYKVNGGTDGTVEIFIDDDSNNRFTPDERRGSGANGTVSLKLGADYYGPVYWKIIATDANGLSASTTGICKIKRREDQEKMVVDLLEIQPPMTASENNKCTLMFCSECQQTGAFMYGNRSADVGMFSRDATSGLSSGFRDHSRLFTETTSSQTFAQVTTTINADPINKFDYSIATIPAAVQTDINNYIAFQYMNDGATGYSKYDNILGIHEHKFGIVKYYSNLELYENANGVASTFVTKGLDDWTTNWFDEIRYDYDVNLTTMTTRQYEAIVDLVNNIYDGQSEADTKLISDEFAARRTDYKLYYDCMRALINGNYDTSISAANKSKFVAFMTTSPTATDAPGLGLTQGDLDAFADSADNLDAFLLRPNTEDYFKDKTILEYGRNEIKHLTDSTIPKDERQYYDVYSLVNSRDSVNAFYNEYDKLYQVWRNAKMYEIYFKNQYVKYGLLASVNLEKSDYTKASYKNTISLDKSFNCILFGASEDFNNDDLKTDASCNAILDYIDDEGNVILMHDTLTARKANGSNGTERMTRLLADAFGQDARHLQYTNTDNTEVENILSVKMNGKVKNVTLKPSHESAEITATAGTTTIQDNEIYMYYTYRNGRSDKQSQTVTITPDITSADIIFYNANNSDGGAPDGVVMNVTGRGSATDAHDIELHIYNYSVNSSGDRAPGSWYTPTVNQWGFSGDITSITMYLNGSKFTPSNTEFNGSTISIPNGKMNGFTWGEPTFTDYTGADTEHQQTLKVHYQDTTGNPVGSAVVEVTNRTTGQVLTATTDVSGNATFDYSNYSTNVTNGTGVKTKPGYKNSEYFISPTLGGVTPNISTLTARCAFYKQMDSQNQVWPTKYTYFDYHGEEVRDDLHRDHDLREIIHAKDKGNTDRTSQTNKGIVTMYPFTIGNQMKISNTTSQSYAVDIEDPNVTVYYTLAGSTAGMVSNMYAADPHNASEGYFIYQKGAITYTGAGHSAVTGYGRDNNDERRLFINIIVNSARKSTMGPDLKLYDYGSTDDNLKNEVIKVVNDADADYAMQISDYTDDVWFDYLANMASGTKFDWVQIYFDVDRSGSEIEVLSADDVLIFEGDTDPASGEVHEDIPNKIGDGLLKEVKTGIAHLAKDATNTPNLVLKETYFNEENKAYIIVRVRDSKGNEDFKRLRIEFKPDLLDLN